jgi:predicted N-acetyltransferase YhbS
MTALRKTPVALSTDAAPFVIRAERASDAVARETLLDACFGANRHARICQRLRDGRAPAEGLALSAVREGRLVATVRLWHVSAGGIPALMLGPLAVDNTCRKLGVGAALMDHALAAAAARGHRAVILLGDAPYYARFGFSDLKTGGLSLPGPFERERGIARGRARRRLRHDRAVRRGAAQGEGNPREEGSFVRAAGGLKRAVMPKNPAVPTEAARSRVRSLISTILFIMISIMIVRDILARRWSAATPPRTDVTERSR